MLTKVLAAIFSVVGLSSANYTSPERSPSVDGVEYGIPPCEGTPFCDRHRTFEQAKLRGEGDDIYYQVLQPTIEFDNTLGTITGKLQLGPDCIGDTSELAPQLDMTVTIYQNGITRVLIEEPGVDRFRISQ